MTLVFDLETAGAESLWSYGPGFVRLAGFDDGNGIVTTTDVGALVDQLHRAGTITGHNILGFDLVVLARHHGIDLPALVDRGAVFDTILAARHVDPPPAREHRKYDLDSLGERLGLGGKNGSLKALAKQFGGFDQIPTNDPRYRAYLEQDVRLSTAVYNHLKTDDAYLAREHRVAVVAAQLSLNGFRIDEQLLAARLAEGQIRRTAALEELASRYGVPTEGASPLASDAGKAALIEAFAKAGAPFHPKTETTGKLSTSAESMTEMVAMTAADFPGNPEIVREVARICELVTTVVGERTIYATVAKHVVDGRVHPNVSMEQSTGRWSITSPGLTVMGKRGGRYVERDVFLPEPGHVIVAVDLAQVDARAVAALSGDPAYRKLFEPGVDAHKAIAQMVWGEERRREDAKAIGHGWNYGMAPRRLAETAGVSLKAAVEFDRTMRERFGRLVEWQNEVREQARSGQLLDNGFGRKMRPDPQRAHTQGPAFMGQGAARDLMMEGLLRLPREVYPYLRGVVHDEVVLSVPTELAGDVERAVIEALTFEWRGVPIRAEVAKRRGASWGQVYAKVDKPAGRELERGGMITERDLDEAFLTEWVSSQGLTCPGWKRDIHPVRWQRDLTIDHIVPRAAGGTDDLANLAVLCRSCNSSKQDTLGSSQQPSVDILHPPLSPFEHADTYRSKGWLGTLPLKAGTKYPPPKGYTGYGGAWPTDEDVWAWSDMPRYRNANLAVRVPQTVLGIDFDFYDNKPGQATVEAAEAEYGSLPRTYVSTSRTDGSGIRPFRVPAGRAWADELGPGAELVHHGHRYLARGIHPEGREYVWLDPDGQIMAEPPAVDDLPELPEAWVALLDRGPVEDRRQKRDVDDTEVRGLVDGLPDGDECPVIAQRCDEALADLSAGGSRHDAMRGGILAVLGYGNQGHRGAGAALARLRSAFERATDDGKRPSDPYEWNRALHGAVAKVTPIPQSRRRCCDDGDEDGSDEAFDEEAFWNARSGLSDLRTFARARQVSPWGMFGCVLAVVASRIGPQVVLPALVGDFASLNFLVGLVGESGGGKDTSLGAALAFLWLDDAVPTHELGTGQGIDSAYTEQTKQGPVQFNDSALFTVTEIDSLKAHAEMGGSNLLATLKKVYTGSALGARYANKEKRRPVKAHRYRFALVAGIQPTHAEVLLRDADGGTPQRWLWLPVNDPQAPHVPPDEPLSGVWGLPIEYQAQGELDGPVQRLDRIILPVCMTAVDETRDIRRKQLLTGAGGLDAHVNLTRLKAAALMSFLDGRAEVSESDWELAAVVVTKSKALRELCELAVTRKARTSNIARAKQEADREDVKAVMAEKRVAAALLRTLRRRGDWVGRSELRHTLRMVDRGHFVAAVERLEGAGQIEMGESEHGRKYRAPIE